MAGSHLKVVWQLRATGIARVHGDEGIAGGHQPDLHPFKCEHAQLGGLGALDGQHLLSHHTQHLQLDTVELIKAGPGSTAGQTLQAAMQRLLWMRPSMQSFSGTCDQSKLGLEGVRLQTKHIYSFVSGMRLMQQQQILTELTSDRLCIAAASMNTTLGLWSVQYLKELAHSLVVKAIAAVEDNTLDGQCLGQILGGLCLTSTGRASRCAT